MTGPVKGERVRQPPVQKQLPAVPPTKVTAPQKTAVPVQGGVAKEATAWQPGVCVAMANHKTEFEQKQTDRGLFRKGLDALTGGTPAFSPEDMQRFVQQAVKEGNGPGLAASTVFGAPETPKETAEGFKRLESHCDDSAKIEASLGQLREQSAQPAARASDASPSHGSIRHSSVGPAYQALQALSGASQKLGDKKGEYAPAKIADRARTFSEQRLKAGDE